MRSRGPVIASKPMAKTIVSSSYWSPPGAQTGARDLLDGRIADIDQRDIGPVEGRVIVGIEADALAADDGARGEQRRHLGVVHQPADLARGRRRLRSRWPRHSTARPRRRCTCSKPPTSHRASSSCRSRSSALISLGGDEVYADHQQPFDVCLRLPPQFPVLRADGGIFFRIVQRRVAGRDGVVRLALEDGEVAALRLRSAGID